MKERTRDTLARYEKNREQITEEVRRGVKKEVQLQMISEYVESLVRFSECHKWDAKGLRTVERYHKSIRDLLEKLIKQVKAHQKEVISLQESEKAIAAQGEAELLTVPKASEDF
jgi:thymidylate synthase ThyX